MSAKIALKSFDLNNSVLQISAQDEIYRFDAEENKRLDREAPWSKECVGVIVLPTGFSKDKGDLFDSLPCVFQSTFLQVMQDFCCCAHQDGTFDSGRRARA